MNIHVSDLIEMEQEAGVRLGPFHRQWLLDTRAPEVVRRNLERARRHPGMVGIRQGFASMDVNDANTAAFAAVASTASETNIVGATQGLINQYCAIAANDARAGKIYKVNWGGIYSNTGTPTVIWTPRWGNNTTVATNITLGASPTYTTITGSTNQPVFGQFVLTVRTAPPGATQGTAYGTGFVVQGMPVTSSNYAQTMGIGNTSGTIDTTGQGAAGCGITVNITHGTSNAANTFTCQWFVLRSWN